MFTGIVQGKGPVISSSLSGGIMRLVVQTPEGFVKDLTKGASISINGVCLTAVSWTATQVEFDVIDETLRLTNLGGLAQGSIVNLERAARFGDEIGGHVLSGHIHDVVTVKAIEKNDDNTAMALAFRPRWAPYVISKGYIAINGCSLTIGQVEDDCFWLHLIPETLDVTNLSDCQLDSQLNVEIDHQTMVIVDTVERVLEQRSKEN